MEDRSAGGGKGGREGRKKMLTLFRKSVKIPYAQEDRREERIGIGKNRPAGKGGEGDLRHKTAHR